MCDHLSVECRDINYECLHCGQDVELICDIDGEEMFVTVVGEDDSCGFCGAPPEKQDADWDWGCVDCGAILPSETAGSYDGPAEADVAF